MFSLQVWAFTAPKLRLKRSQSLAAAGLRPGFFRLLFLPQDRENSTGGDTCHLSSSPWSLHLLVFARSPCIAVICFQPPTLLGTHRYAWGPKRGRRKILSGPCCESFTGLANSASPGCKGLNQIQLTSLEILCTTTSFTSEAKPHEPPSSAPNTTRDC